MIGVYNNIINIGC